VRAVLPLRRFLLMAFLTAADHGVDVQSAEADGIAVSAANVLDKAAGVPQVEARIEGENFAVARAASDGAVSGGCQEECSERIFVAAGTGFSGGIFVVQAGGGRPRTIRMPMASARRARRERRKAMARLFLSRLHKAAERDSIGKNGEAGLKPPLVTWTLPSIT